MSKNKKRSRSRSRSHDKVKKARLQVHKHRARGHEKEKSASRSSSRARKSTSRSSSMERRLRDLERLIYKDQSLDRSSPTATGSSIRGLRTRSPLSNGSRARSPIRSVSSPVAGTSYAVKGSRTRSPRSGVSGSRTESPTLFCPRETSPYSLQGSQSEEDGKEDDNNILDIDLDDETLKCLGNDHSKDAIQPVMLHKSLVNIWDNIISKGLEKDAMKELVLKYPKPSNSEFLDTPKLNEEIEVILNFESKKDPKIVQALKWDRRLSSLQQYISAATVGLGCVMNVVLADNKFPNREEIITHSGNIGQILTNIHHVTSLYRRAAIAPCISKQAKEVGFNKPVDEFLLGKNFGENYKKLTDLEKATKNIKHKNSSNYPKQKYSAYGNPGYTSQAYKDDGKNYGSTRPLNSWGPSRRPLGDARQRGQPLKRSYSQSKRYNRERKN